MEIGLHDTRQRQDKTFSKLPGFRVVQQAANKQQIQCSTERCTITSSSSNWYY